MEKEALVLDASVIEEKLELVDDVFSMGFDVVTSNKEILSAAMKSALDTDTSICSIKSGKS